MVLSNDYRIFAESLAAKRESDGGTTVENCCCIEVFEIKSLRYHKQFRSLRQRGSARWELLSNKSL